MNEAIAVLLVFIALSVWGWIYDRNKARKQKLKCEADSQAFMEAQKLVPNYWVEIKTKTGKTFETEKLEPRSRVAYTYWGWEHEGYTSLSLAQDYIENSIENDSFYHKNQNQYFPMCEIEYMRATNERPKQ